MFFLCINTYAQFSSIEFIENKGQWDDNIQFKAKIPSGNIYLEANQLTYQFYDEQDMARYHDLHHGLVKKTSAEDYIMDVHSFKVKFLNASSDQISPSVPTSDYENYFIGNDQTKWASHVKKYNQAAYQNIYPSIDLKFYLKEHFLKYDFIVKKGGDAAQIQCDYNGVEGIFLEKGALKITTSVNEIIEQKPYAYQIVKGKLKEVKCHFKLEGTTVSFDFPRGYNKELELIIDPVLVFASYSGSTFDNWGYTSTFDDAGHLYGGGVTFGVGYPVTTGAYQVNYAGGNIGVYDSDITITKFSPDGTSLIYSTYLGGAMGVECPHSLIVNNNDELIILGTTSSSDYPVSSAAYDITFNGGVDYTDVIPQYIGGSDFVVSKLNGSGTVLTGSTYVGGSGNDGLNLGTDLNYNYADEFRGEVIIDADDNVYVASSTLSTDFPVAAGAFQSTNNGLQDGCVFKLNAALTALSWSSYIGGANEDAAYSLALNGLSEVIVTGGTKSIDFPTVAPGLNTSFQLGVSDGWIAKINPTGTAIVSSTFLGTSEYDQSYFVDTDIDNNVYVVGQTEGAYSIEPVTVYRDSNSGQFLHKLSPDLSITIFSTTFGTSSGEIDIALSAFLVNECNYIFVSGWGGATNVFNGGPPFSTTIGLPITTNAIQPTTDGSDYYLTMFNENAESLQFATYFGGSTSNDHVDGGTSRFDKRGIVYQAVCSSCGASFDDFPTTPAAWSNTNNSSNCNLGVFKVDLSTLTASADVYTTPFHCVGDTVRFQNNSNGGISQIWNFGDGATSSLMEPTHIYETAGTYNVQLIVLDPISCILSDTAYVEVYIGSPPEITINPVTGICRGDSIQLNVVGATSYSWAPNYNILNDSTATPTVWPDTTTIYTVIATDSCGMDTTEIEVVVFSKEISILADTMICLGETAQLEVFGAASSVWTPSTGLNDPNISNPMATPIENTTYTVSGVDLNTCQYDTMMTVFVDTILPVLFDPVNQAICVGDSVQIYTSAIAVNTYEWSPNSTLLTPNDSLTWAKPSTTTAYVLKGINGCSTTYDTVVVVVNVPQINASEDLVVCAGKRFEIWASGGMSYIWSVSGGIVSVDSSFATSIIAPSRFYVEIIDTNNCVDTSSVFVNLLEKPTLELGVDIQTFWGNQVVLQPITNGVTFQWTPLEGLSCTTCQNPTVTATESTTFYLTVADASGCLSFDTITITYNGSLYVPNSFTPNGDGDNDFFRAFGKDIIEFEMSIYDRWGELLFHTENMKNNWNGTYRGTLAKTETYIWKIKYTEVLGTKKKLFGKVTLLR
jgi:gliding motility-associated-like protein